MHIHIHTNMNITPTIYAYMYTYIFIYDILIHDERNVEVAALAHPLPYMNVVLYSYMVLYTCAYTYIDI